MPFHIVEHQRASVVILSNEEDQSNLEEFKSYKGIQPRTFINKRNQSVPYFKLYHHEDKIEVQADYYVGLDWLIPNKQSIYIAPKVNTKVIEKFRQDAISAESEIEAEDEDNEPFFDKVQDYQELNYLKILLDVTTHPDVLRHSGDLLFIDWDAPEIEVEQKEDLLTPFLIIRFLNLLKQIVQKGLKKSYYQMEHNLQSKIKGKILIGQNIKTNIVKNRFTRTLCVYQEFGIDNEENRFLKKVLSFVVSYLSNSRALFNTTEKELMAMVSYCNPAFEMVSQQKNDDQLKQIKPNVLFKEYSEAIRTGQQILKRFAYNISFVAQEKTTIPPFWIDMPRLFELFVYQQLLNVFQPHEVHYHYTAKGNELDFLIVKKGFEMVVDAKYKLHYKAGLIHQDIRQVSGYARLEKVYKELKIENNVLIGCLIIYPDLQGYAEIPDFHELKKEENKIKAYRKFFKLGIQVPIL